MSQIQLSKFAKRDRRGDSTSLFPRKEKGTSAWEVDLKKQMQAWKENPSWNDQPPEIKVKAMFQSSKNLIQRKEMKCSNFVILLGFEVIRGGEPKLNLIIMIKERNCFVS